MSRKVIFFIDDENNRTVRWREYLAQVYEVRYFPKPIPLAEIEAIIISEGPVAIIQDIMMKGEKDGSVDIRVGLDTAKNIKDILIRLRIPIVLFSNRMLKEFAEELIEMQFPADILYVKYKPETGYKDLLLFVQELVGV